MRPMTRYLSGIQPTGKPHLGNYFGAIKEHIECAKSAQPGEAFYFVADYHALTNPNVNSDELEQNIRAIAATYLALGLDPNRAVLFRQSDVPEVTELAWILATSTGMGLLERAHSYKDKVAKGMKPNVGLFTYPLLMAADILIYDPDIVPVGKDQIQHIEMTQDMVTYIDTRFGQQDESILKRPEWKLSQTPKVVGIDGEKMSSSYGNDIWIFESGKALKKRVNKIVTDSKAPEEAKNPDEVIPLQLLKLFVEDATYQEWATKVKSGGEGAPGYGHIKKALMDAMDTTFEDARLEYQRLMERDEGKRELDQILTDGGKKARSVAQSVLLRVMQRVGLGHVTQRLSS